MRLKLIILSFFSLLLLVSCNETENQDDLQLLTEEQRNQEKEAIISVINNYNIAMNSRDWAGLVRTLNEEVTFFGSDDGEVTKDMATFKESIKKQWEDYPTLEYGQIQDIYIELDNYGTFANIMFGLPLKTISKSGINEDFFVIVQRTLKKNLVEQKWTICSGILSIPRIISEEKTTIPAKK